MCLCGLLCCKTVTDVFVCSVLLQDCHGCVCVFCCVARLSLMCLCVLLCCKTVTDVFVCSVVGAPHKNRTTGSHQDDECD